MRFGLFLLILSTVPAAFGQAPVTVVDAGWKVDRQPAPRAESQYVPPQKEVTADDKYWARKRRESEPRGGAPDPSETSLDGRRAALDKINDEARSVKSKDIDGYTYRASIKNDTQKVIRIVFWEFRFTELANPSNVVRRQFLCTAEIKPGDKKELSTFSTLGPSDVIAVGSLSKTAEKLFDEKVTVNRVEFADDSVLNRPGWKFDDNKKAIDHITSTPWGKETCRAF